MKRNEPFSIIARGRSIKCAVNGIVQFLNTEHNSLVHLLATIIVIILAIIFPVSTQEKIALAIVIGFVWTAELFNTAIEKIMDLLTVKEDYRIRYIKDVSAAAVLVSAITALTTGCIIFIPKTIALWK